MRKRNATMLALAAALSIIGGAAAAETPSPVRVGQAPARMALLRPGVHRYVRYSIKDGRRSTMDIWTRTVAFEPHAGVRRLHITQEWDRVVPPTSTLVQDSWFDARTFAPLTHVRRADKEGVVTVGGYRFSPGEVVGMTGLPDNTR